MARQCGIEIWEYWPATGATAALPICAELTHVEEIHLFGGFYHQNSIWLDIIRFAIPVKKGTGQRPKLIHWVYEFYKL